MWMNLGRQTKATRVQNAAAAGTTNLNGSVVDMLGFDGVVFVYGVGTLTAGQNTKLKVQGGTLADGSDMTDLANSGNPAGASTFMPDGDSNKILVTDLVKPIQKYRYYRSVLVRGTQNAVVDFGIAVQYSSQRDPIQSSLQDTSLSGGAVVTLITPLNGTAN